MTNTITINSHEAPMMRALLHIVSKEQSRPYLHGIYYDAPRNRMVATDGHIMAYFQLSEPSEAESFIIPAHAVPKKPARREPDCWNIEVKPDSYTVHNGADASVRPFTPIKGTFPDYMRFIPEDADKAPLSFGLGHKVMTQLQKIMTAMDKHNALVMTFNSKSPQSPIKGKIGDLNLVIMPVRI